MPDDTRIEAFVGPRADYYRERWQAAGENVRPRLSFNLAACFMQVTWLAYRKLYVPLAWVIVALFADVGIVLFVEHEGLMPRAWIDAWNVIATILYLVLIGLLGNRWYWNRYRDVVAKAAAIGGGADAELDYVRSKGGTSMPAAVLVTLALLVPAMWGGYHAAMALLPAAFDIEGGYVFDATGPLTLAEVRANLIDRLDEPLEGARRDCVFREIEARAAAAGDPETLDPTTVEFVPADRWDMMDPFGRRLILAQAISTKAMFECR